MKIQNIMISVLIVLCITACIETGTNESGTFKVIDPIIVGDGDQVTFATLKSSILEPMCLRCHSWVTDEVKVDSRITAGKPDSSTLFKLVESGSMPAGGPALNLDQLDIVRRYIVGKGTPASGGGDVVVKPPTPAPTPRPPAPIPTPLPSAPTFAELHEKILAPKCIGCHKRMDTEAGLARYLEPGDALGSELYQVVEEIGRAHV